MGTGKYTALGSRGARDSLRNSLCANWDAVSEWFTRADGPEVVERRHEVGDHREAHEVDLPPFMVPWGVEEAQVNLRRFH